ncbi:hypothetical protein Aglo03_23510 [Actinokineospora globicatena]|uniref:Regulatory protein RecX n=1 Tax=Actinokineospora globicatena TaxID=103729 RepID=A0A9W6V6G1_9PSEU|nr:hypothetical protein Aglo03_23510 [Actinokineospora globicatena]
MPEDTPRSERAGWWHEPDPGAEHDAAPGAWWDPTEPEPSAPAESERDPVEPEPEQWWAAEAAPAPPPEPAGDWWGPDDATPRRRARRGRAADPSADPGSVEVDRGRGVAGSAEGTGAAEAAQRNRPRAAAPWSDSAAGGASRRVGDTEAPWSAGSDPAELSAACADSLDSAEVKGADRRRAAKPHERGAEPLLEGEGAPPRRGRSSTTAKRAGGSARAGTSRCGAEGSGESTVESARASGKVWESAVPSADSTAVDLAREQLAALRERAAARPSPEVGPGPDGGAPDHGADERQPRRRAKAEPVELSRDEWAAKARDICYRQLAARDRTRLELAQVLRRKEIPDDIAEVVLGKFDAAGLINDAAFAESWVRSRHAHRGLGRRALATELRRKGVDDEVVAEAVAAVDADAEQERAADLVAKKLGAMRALDEQTKIRRLVAMLARRGYGEGMAYRVVRAALDGGDPAD